MSRPVKLRALSNFYLGHDVIRVGEIFRAAPEVAGGLLNDVRAELCDDSDRESVNAAVREKVRRMLAAAGLPLEAPWQAWRRLN